MMFFSGMHHPHNAWRVPAAFVSVNALRRRKGGFRVGRWIMDSGAFTTVNKHGGYPWPAAEYAAQIERFKNCGTLLAAVAEDYMCEPFVLEKTGLTVTDHQRLTIERYDALLACKPSVYVMPVLQGYHPRDYVIHVRAYGARLAHRAWVGVGSVCKRNANPAIIALILLLIKRERPDLRLHGFGLKKTALQWGLIRKLLFSSDSMAWSFAARREGRDANDPQEAIDYRRRLRVQKMLPIAECRRQALAFGRKAFAA